MKFNNSFSISLKHLISMFQALDSAYFLINVCEDGFVFDSSTKSAQLEVNSLPG